MLIAPAEALQSVGAPDELCIHEPQPGGQDGLADEGNR